MAEHEIDRVPARRPIPATEEPDVETAAPLKKHGDALRDGSGSRHGSDARIDRPDRASAEGDPGAAGMHGSAAGPDDSAEVPE